MPRARTGLVQRDSADALADAAGDNDRRASGNSRGSNSYPPCTVLPCAGLLGFRFPELKAIVVKPQDAAGFPCRRFEPVFEGSAADGISASVAGIAGPRPDVEAVSMFAGELAERDPIPNPVQKRRDLTHETSLFELL
jgi:hypothetical protein